MNTPKHLYLGEKQFGLYNLNRNNTNSEPICNRIVSFMTILIFLTLILLFHVIVSCSQSKIRFLDYLIRLLRNFLKKIIKKNQGSRLPYKELFVRLRPSKSKIPLFSPIFHFLNFFIFSENPKKKHALVLFDFKNFLVVFLYIFYFIWCFYHFFYFVFCCF